MRDDGLRPVLDKLARLGTLDRDDLDAFAELPYRMQTVPAGRRLVREGQAPGEFCVLLDGYACRHKTTKEGARQIVSFHIPGDMLDVQHLKLARADHDVEAI